MLPTLRPTVDTAEDDDVGTLLSPGTLDVSKDIDTSIRREYLRHGFGKSLLDNRCHGSEGGF